LPKVRDANAHDFILRLPKGIYRGLFERQVFAFGDLTAAE
jgi:hypothetical protein